MYGVIRKGPLHAMFADHTSSPHITAQSESISVEKGKGQAKLAGPHVRMAARTRMCWWGPPLPVRRAKRTVTASLCGLVMVGEVDSGGGLHRANLYFRSDWCPEIGGNWLGKSRYISLGRQLGQVSASDPFCQRHLAPH